MQLRGIEFESPAIFTQLSYCYNLKTLECRQNKNVVHIGRKTQQFI
jgi:hypothetical protein